MIPNVPLHSMVESSWVVPRDDSLECSLFILEQQEKEYNDRLSSISNIAAPEPIGMRQSSISNTSTNTSAMGMGVGGTGARSSGVGSSSPNRSSRSGRSSRRQSSGTNRSTYGYTPPPTGTSASASASASASVSASASAATPTGASSRRASYRREMSSEEISTVASVDTVHFPIVEPLPSPSPSNRRRRERSTLSGSPSSYYSVEDTSME